MRSSPEVVRSGAQDSRVAAPAAVAFRIRARSRLTGGFCSASAALFSRPTLFANDLLGLFVGPQAEINRLAKLALAGPLRELHFRDQRRTYPRRDPLILHLGRKRRSGGFEPHQL